MDLIYADENLTDLGVLIDYSFDMAYGNSENTFECRVQSDNHVCKQDYVLYVEFTEYGGVVDRIESDSRSGEIVYMGRTWHGILNSFVIAPPERQTYRMFEGSAADVLQSIIDMFDLNDLFTVDRGGDDIEIRPFDVRYEHAYDAILRMLKQENAKLFMIWRNGKVNIGVLQAVNYATNEELSTSQIPFRVGYTYNNVNHLVCLGAGEGQYRAVIHLYCDEGGNVQPYTFVSEPFTDWHYMSDNANAQYKVMRGREEITMIYDYPNAEVRYTYIPLNTKISLWNFYYTDYYKAVENSDSGEMQKVEKVFEDEYHIQYSQPPDWKWRYNKYYYKTNSGYSEVDPIDVYVLLTAQPDDWKRNYKDYFVKKGSQYNAVTAVETTSYKVLEKQPDDWKKKYASYYTYFWDGTQAVYNSVSPRIKYNYEKQTKRPTDWLTNYGNYYVNLKAGKYVVGNKTTKYKGGFYSVSEALRINALPTRITNIYTLTLVDFRTDMFMFKLLAGKVLHLQIPTGRTVLLNTTDSDPKAIRAITRNNLAFTYTCLDATTGAFTNADPNTWTAYTGVTSVSVVSEEAVMKLWKKNKFYTRYSKGYAPLFKYGPTADTRFYRKAVKTSAPEWAANTYYRLDEGVAPAWQANKYYTKFENVEQIPEFAPGEYFERYEDRFAALIEGALKKLEELRDTSTMEVDLDVDTTYDVGDTVGAIDEVTKIEVTRDVTKKIIKIVKGIEYIECRVD